MQIKGTSSPECSGRMRSFYYSLPLSYTKLSVPEQIEYEDPVNDPDYEEYEIDEDSFDSARRERPETWKRDVYL